MISRRRTTLINIGFKYIQLALALVTGLILVPIYLQFIPASEYGTWLATASIVIWLSVFDPGIANILTQRIAEALGRNTPHAILGFINSGLICTIAISAAILSIGWLGTDLYLDFIREKNSPLPLVNVFHVLILTTAMMVAGYSLIGISLGLQVSLEIGLIYTTATLCKVATALALLWSDYGLMALAYAELASATVISVSALILLIHRLGTLGIHYRFTLDGFREITGLFMTSFGARFSKIVARSVDNVFVARLLGHESVALYNLTATAPRQMENLLNHSIGAFRPAIAHLGGSENLNLARRLLTRLLRIIVWAAGLLAAWLLAYNDDFVALWVGHALFAGPEISLLLCWLFFIHVWTNTTGTLGFSLGDIKRNSQVEWLSSIMLAVALWFGAKHYGLAGVVAAHIAVLTFTGAWYFPWSLARRLRWDRDALYALAWSFAKTGMALAITTFVAREIEPSTWPQLVWATALLSLCYLSIMAALSREFREEARNFIKWGRSTLQA